MSTTATIIESLGDHDHLVRIAMDGEVVTVRAHADPDLVARIAGADADERQVVAATIDYLTARQRPDDLPAFLDLRDVAAAYDDYVDRLHADCS